MLLHDLMDDAVADVTADLPELARTSRRQGTAARRRRRAITAVGVAVAGTVLAAGVYALVPGDRGSDSTVATDVGTEVRVGELSGRTAPITARGAAAALADAVTDRVPGTISSLQGSADRGEAMATLVFLPDHGPGPAGTVFLNLQPISMAPEKPGCAMPWMATCSLEQQPNGDIRRTYLEEDDTEFGQGSQRLTVEVISPDRGLRLVVSAMNTSPSADGAMGIMPVLTSGELRDIAALPWWGRTRLPVEYVEAGERLDDYADATENES
ncbi:hypothetical protein [Nocardioides sp.]|uniref:hypothetical protein n=1 Tax=Nocardioides sp. TaxID=35761 RepID=UPI0025FA892C|nr:hypothetical protein [Nocardioides sp.]